MFSQPEFNVFVADLSREVTSAMLLVGHFQILNLIFYKHI